MRHVAHTLVLACLAGLLTMVPAANSPIVEPVNGAPDTDQLPSGGDGPCPTGIIEGPDPIGASVECEKDPKRDTGAPDEYESAPAVGYHVSDGAPFVVWPERNAGDRDIAYRSWDDGAWGEVEYLTSSLADERDPAVWVTSDGTVQVVWWSEQNGVEGARRDPSSGEWSPIFEVAGRGFRPVVATIEEQALIAFLRVEEDGSRAVILARETTSGLFDQEIVAVETTPGAIEIGFERGVDGLLLDWGFRDGQPRSVAIE